MGPGRAAPRLWSPIASGYHVTIAHPLERAIRRAGLIPLPPTGRTSSAGMAPPSSKESYAPTRRYRRGEEVRAGVEQGVSCDAGSLPMVSAALQAVAKCCC
jgi:hypothetical protein